MSNAEIVKSSGTEIARETRMGSTELEKRNETASSAVVAQARAAIEARFVIARSNPRDDDLVRARLLRECKRTSFADRAIYSLPRGDKPGRLTKTPGRVEGLTVRFAERAMGLMGNMLQQTRTVYDDAEKRIVNVSCVDLETNATYERDLVIEKTVERRKPKKDQRVLSKRTNSAGDEVFLCQATEDEITEKEGRSISKATRTFRIALLPPDTLDECERQIVATIRSDVERDPDAAKKKTADAFAELGVTPAHLREYLGHDLGVSSPVEIQELRGLFGALREGEITWTEALAAVLLERGPKPAEDGPEIVSSAGKVVARIRDIAKSKAQPKTGPTAQPAEGEQKKPSEQETKASPGSAAQVPALGDTKPETATRRPTAPAGPPEETCMICKKTIVGAKIETSDREGVVGFRHYGCSPFGVTDEDGGSDPDLGP